MPDGRRGLQVHRKRDETVWLVGQRLGDVRGSLLPTLLTATLLLVPTLPLLLRRRTGICGDARVAAVDGFETSTLELRARLFDVRVLRSADDELVGDIGPEDVEMRHTEAVALQLVDLALVARFAVERLDADAVLLFGFSGHQRCSWVRVKPSTSSPRCHSRRSTLPWPVFAEEKRRKPCRCAGVWTTRIGFASSP